MAWDPHSYMSHPTMNHSHPIMNEIETQNNERKSEDGSQVDKFIRGSVLQSTEPHV